MERKVKFDLLSVLTHSSISRRNGKIYHARGLQISSRKKYPLLIGGDTNAQSYRVFVKEENIYIYHGTGKYINNNTDKNIAIVRKKKLKM